jgi:hypothetical protein
MLSSCFYYGVLLNLPECQAGKAAKHAGSWISATILTGWITAIATAILAAGAIFTVIYAIRAFRAQARELAILVEQHDRDETERRTAQAAQVFVGADRTAGTLVRPYVKNGSDFPIFDAESWESRPGDLRRLEDLGVILPGETPFAGPQRNRDDALARTILTFRDANNVRWVRMSNGTYKQQARDTARDSIVAALAETATDGQPAA